MLRGRYTPFNLEAFNKRLDHGLLLGLADQADHTYALYIDGTNSPTADIDWGGKDITNITNITGTGLITMGSGLIDQNSDAVGLLIDSEATTVDNYGLSVITGEGTAIAGHFAFGHSDANGACFLGGDPLGNASAASFAFSRNLGFAATGVPVVKITQDNGTDDQAALEIRNGGTGPHITTAGNMLITAAGGTVSFDDEIILTTNLGRLGTIASTGGTASGTGAFAFGQTPTASGDYSFAVGADIGKAVTLASATGAIAIGSTAQSTDIECVAIGAGAAASSVSGNTGNSSAAIGFGATASGDKSLAIGTASMASAASALAVGALATASATESVAVGFTVLSTAAGAFSFGSNFTNSTASSVALGISSPDFMLDATTLKYTGTGSFGDGGATNYTQISATGDSKYVGSAKALNLSWDTETFTGDDTLDTENVVALLDGSSNTVTITLPTAAGIQNRIYYIKSIDATFTTDVATNGSETIDDDASFTLAAGESITIVSDNANWWII